MDLKRIIRLLKTSPWLAPVLAGIDVLLWLTDQLAMRLAKQTPVQANSLVILRFDVLGDYLAFRAYMHYLKTQSAYSTHHFTLVGNQAFRGLAYQLDSDIVDEFIWVDIYQLSTNLTYRFKVVQQLRELGAETVFCPTYSRVLVLDDFLARATNAPTRIGCVSDGINLTRWEVGWGNRQYTRLLATQADFEFEVIRNQQIISSFLDYEVPIQLPHIDADRLPTVTTPVPSIVLSLGAGQAFRVWPTNHFAVVVQYLHTHYPDHTILLTGAPGEEVYADALLAELPDPGWVQNLTGNLSLLDLLAVLHRADLLISNETGTVHLAAALGTWTIVISQGKSLVRWHPYPAALTAPVWHIYPLYIEQHRADLAAIAPQFNPESPFAMTDVSASQVIEQIERLLARKTV